VACCTRSRAPRQNAPREIDTKMTYLMTAPAGFLSALHHVADEQLRPYVKQRAAGNVREGAPIRLNAGSHPIGGRPVDPGPMRFEDCGAASRLSRGVFVGSNRSPFRVRLTEVDVTTALPAALGRVIVLTAPAMRQAATTAVIV
jgi:hypothetical protein